jgi:hypothetical protein
MMRKAALTALIACSATFFSVDVLGCGESLFRVGKGLTYRDYTAPFPGNILIVANTEGETRHGRASRGCGASRTRYL